MAHVQDPSSTEALRNQIQALEEQLHVLKQKLSDAEQPTPLEPHTHREPQLPSTTWPLEPDEYKRYGRQLILPNIGRAGV